MRRGLSTAAVAAVLAGIVVAGCASRPADEGVAVAGDTRVDLVTVAAPRLVTPTLDVTVGITKPQGPTTGAGSKSTSGQTASRRSASRQPTPAGVLATVTVRAGDSVRSGEVLAAFDDRVLRLGVENAEAAHRKALATADALKSQAAELRDTRSTLRDKRSTLRGQLSDVRGSREKIEAQLPQLESQISQLRATVPKLQAALPQLRAGLAAAEQQLAAAEQASKAATPPPGIGERIAALKAQIAKLRSQIAQAQQAIAALPRLEALHAQLDSALAQLKTAEGKISSGLGQMSDALSQLSTGIDQLSEASDLVRVASGAQAVGVDLAKAALAQATLRAPAAGVVTSAMNAGEVAMVGAPVVVIRPAGATLVDTYLTAEQLTGVKVGTPAEVSLDSVAGSLEGSVSAVSGEEDFPPTNYPTKIVHLSRVVRVTVSVPETLPLGVPADVVIRPSR